MLTARWQWTNAHKSRTWQYMVIRLDVFTNFDPYSFQICPPANRQHFKYMFLNSLPCLMLHVLVIVHRK